MKNILILVLFLTAPAALAKLHVTATTSDAGALVTVVARDRVEVLTIAKGTQDPHQIEAKPSFMVKMRSTDLVVAQGLELESAWLNPLIDGSRNPKLAPGKRGVLELAGELEPIEVPRGEISRTDGDVHPGGNPHFQTDPIRLGKAALLVAERLGELDRDNAEFFKTNAREYKERLEKKTAEWRKRIEKSGVKEVVTYHKLLSYFFDRFAIRSALQLEPKPGIPPTASHLLDTIDQMKRRDVKLVLIESIYDDSAAAKLRSSVPGVRVQRVPAMVGGAPGIETSEQLIEALVSAIEGVH